MTQRLLPDGWVETTLGDTSDYIRGVTYKKEHSSLVEKPDFLPILRANNIQDGQIILDDLVYVHKDLIQQKQLIQNADIVIAMSSGSKSVVGKAAQVLKDFNGSFGAFCGVLRPKANIDSRFVRHFTQTIAYRNQISNLSAGANINNLKPAYFYQIPIPLPPLAEQRHIAKVLDDSLAMVAQIRERLDSVQQQLKRFRQSVLADAVSGRLTADWRGSESYQTINGFVYCQEWFQSTLGNQFNYGKTNKADAQTIADTTWVLELEDIEKESSRLLQKVFNQDRQVKSTKNTFKKGDVLYGKLRPYLDKVIIADDDGVCTTEIIPIATRNQTESKYLFYWLKSPYFLNHINQLTYGVNMPRLGTTDGKNSPFFYPPLPEQQEIVRRVDALFAHAEQIEQRMTAAMTQVERLVQSLLAAAFDGSLSRAWRDANQALITGEHSAAALLAQLTQQPSTKARTKKSTKTAINPV